MNRSALACTAILAVSLLAHGILSAGPLNPPGGPVSSTYKTLTEVEPRTAISAANTPGDNLNLFSITQPGSYYLTGNITGVSAKNGIRIAASGVTLDLNGFELLGVAGSLSGVLTSVPAARNVTVKNGAVRSWGQSGINLTGATILSARVADITAADNGVYGIQAGGTAAISHCTSAANAYGFSSGSGTTFTACTAYSNTNYGFFLSNGNTLEDCTSHSNTEVGISVGVGSVVRGCSCYNNATGISANSGTTVAECTCRNNDGDGIITGTACLILNNNCNSNGQVTADGAGIHVTTGDCRIEGNTCSLQKRGIAVDVSGNFLVRNTCSGNTVANYVFVSGNVYGPILDRSAAGGAAVNGSSAASTLGTTDANANFSF